MQMKAVSSMLDVDGAFKSAPAGTGMCVWRDGYIHRFNINNNNKYQYKFTHTHTNNNNNNITPLTQIISCHQSFILSSHTHTHTPSLTPHLHTKAVPASAPTH